MSSFMGTPKQILTWADEQILQLLREVERMEDPISAMSLNTIIEDLREVRVNEDLLVSVEVDERRHLPRYVRANNVAKVLEELGSGVYDPEPRRVLRIVASGLRTVKFPRGISRKVLGLKDLFSESPSDLDIKELIHQLRYGKVRVGPDELVHLSHIIQSLVDRRRAHICEICGAEE